MKTIIIDNYDSFTYNLYQYISAIKGNPIVFKNDKIDLSKIKTLNPTHIVISPGPGTPENPKDIGICEKIILNFMNKIPILGVCLGHQLIVKTLGGIIEQAPIIMHGKQSKIIHTEKGIFKGIRNPFLAMRYHSLCASRQNFPKELEITAKHVTPKGQNIPGKKHEQNEHKSIKTTDETIMGIQHRKYPLFGIQFHPESFKTPEGGKILQNFINL